LLERSLIYATDINPRRRWSARRGVFALDRMRAVHRELPEGGRQAARSPTTTRRPTTRAVRPRLMENVTFADHSLATDSVFSETHLVSCRNVLIYFNRKLQDRALGLFHESLCHRGFLGLGSKESIDFSAYATASSRWPGASACSARWPRDGADRFQAALAGAASRRW
jgi:chemotaxis protein methyltransferase CheR